MTVNISLFAGAGAQFFDNNGVPLAGGLLYTYSAGTTTPLATYTTNSGSTANSNPIVLDSSGRVSNEIWLTAGNTYKFILQTSAGVQIGSYDNIPGANDLSSLSASNGSSLIGYIESASTAVARTVQSRLRDFVSVKDFGAKGDGTTDDTTAVKNALASLSSTGGTVYFPSGQYKLTSQVTVPSYVKMMGQNWLPDPSNGAETFATSLYIAWGSGNAIGSGNSAIVMSFTSAIEGFTFYYPGQVAKTSSTPVVFDYSISTPIASGVYDNIQIRNITLYNSYAGINLVSGGRWRVEEIQGNPLYIGFNCDQNYDVCYMSKVHFWPFYTQNPSNLGTWVLANGTGMQFGRVDQAFCDDLFVYGYSSAINCQSTTSGGTWASFNNILVDTANYCFTCSGINQILVNNFIFIPTASTLPAILTGAGGSVQFSNGKITNTGSVGAQIDGGTSVQFSNVDFQNQHSAVVCTNTTTLVKLDSACVWNVPPWGTSNVMLGNNKLPSIDTQITLPSPTTAPTVISGGYQFNLNSTSTQTLSWDITNIAQKNSLYVLVLNFECPVADPLFYFQFSVKTDTGSQIQVNFSPTYPLTLDNTISTTRAVYIPFFVNGAIYKTLAEITVTPTVAVSGATLNLTGIALYEQGNSHTTDAQVASMITNGYNLDYYNLGCSLMAKGPNRKVYPYVDTSSGRTNEIPNSGTWLDGDEMVTRSPTASGNIGYVCTTAGTPGTWKPFGTIGS